ncbi:MAG: sensor histidine kinase [Lachnospiraceae bacterium]|jgi:signal transduction histidine kinase
MRNKIKKPPQIKKRRHIALLLFLGYLAGIVVGCFIIWIIPVTKNRADLLEISFDKGKSVLSYKQGEDVLLFGMEYWMFNEQGSMIIHESSFLHESQWDSMHNYVQPTLEKGQLFIPTVFKLDNRGGKPTKVFGIVASTLVEASSGYRFVSILLRDLTDVDITMVIYACLFTIVYAVGVFFTVTTVKKERELNNMRRDLVANVSHELKTPITAIKAMAETLHDGMLKDAASRKAYSSGIIVESDKLERLVWEILELSKLQSSRTAFNKKPIRADILFPPIVDRYIMMCTDMKINLYADDLQLEKIPMLETDAQHISSLLSILLDNAIKFTGGGGTIRLSARVHPKYVVFCVKDNGPGIEPSDARHIFDRFYKADTAHNSQGSGLGLAIADEIVRGLNEKLWVESTYGEGSSFFFTVSCKQVH